jgi:nucleotide-binding universal stress UspA family protein
MRGVARLPDGGRSVSRIVVGVDASPGARGALAWAAGEARLRQAVLQVVYAYRARGSAGPDYYASEHELPAAAGIVSPEVDPAPQDMSAMLVERGELDEAAHNRADNLLDTVLGELGDVLTGVDVQLSVIDDRHPAEALLEASEEADLLVVGSRGGGGFSKLRLGSVSHAVVLHAVCPVVVVPQRRA